MSETHNAAVEAEVRRLQRTPKWMLIGLFVKVWAAIAYLVIACTAIIIATEVLAQSGVIHAKTAKIIGAAVTGVIKFFFGWML